LLASGSSRSFAFEHFVPELLSSPSLETIHYKVRLKISPMFNKWHLDLTTTPLYLMRWLTPTKRLSILVLARNQKVRCLKFMKKAWGYYRKAS
jgi:hypothetical protein